MRASELLGSPVLSGAGERRGVVIDIRARAEPAGEGEIGLVVDGFVIGTRGWRLLGYERHGERGPAVLAALLRLLHRRTRYVQRSDVDLRPDRSLRLLRPWEELPRVPTIR